MKYTEASHLSETNRIQVIGDATMAQPDKINGFLVDKEGPNGYEKADRYIHLLAEQFPKIRVIFKGFMTLKSVEVVLVKITAAPKEQMN